MGAGINTARAGRRNARRSRHQPMAEINVTPFVDVMLVLLIIFMVSAPLLTAGVPIELPETSAQPAETTPDAEPLTITVDSKGAIFLQDSQIAIDDIAAKLGAIGKLRAHDAIYLRGDNGANYGALMQVMGKINAAGFERILLVTNVEESG